MDPFAPVSGVSLERYAELAADVSEISDPRQQAEIASRKGVSPVDWEAAKAGWTARMQDTSLMGAVASRFMPLYQAALARRTPTPQVSYEDYVALCASSTVRGIEAMLAYYRLSLADWTQVAGHWNATIVRSPQYAQHGMLVQHEAARLRVGGAPRSVALGVAALPPPLQPESSPRMVSGAMPGHVPPPGYGAQPAPPAYAAAPYVRPSQPYYAQQAAQLGNDVGNAFSALGSALGSLVSSAVGGIAVGAHVMVQWSDGHHYPGTVVMMQSGQVQVSFPDGRRVWVFQQYVTPRGPGL